MACEQPKPSTAAHGSILLASARPRMPGSVLLATLLVGCGAGAPDPPPAMPVTVYRVSPETAEGDHRYSANLEPYTQVDVDFQVAGTVATITEVPGVDAAPRDLQAGDRVRPGDVLAKLDDEIYRDQVEQARQQLVDTRAGSTKAAQDYERDQKLHEKQFVSDSDFDASRASRDSSRAQTRQAQAALDQAQTQLSYATLTSPLEGIVVQREIEIGDLVGAGTTAFQLADTSRMKALFAVPASLAIRLEPGRQLRLSIDELPDAPLEGRVSRIDAAADQKTRAFDVEVTLPNPGAQLRIGMVATVLVPVSSAHDSSLMIPLASVVRPPDDPKQYAVFVVAEPEGSAHASLRSVELGEVFADRIAVLRGLEAGDAVVVRGATLVHEGQPVRVLP